MIHLVNDPTFAVRIASATLGVFTLVGIVAAGIAIGVVISRQTDTTSPFVRTTITTVVRSDISVALDRLIMSYELAKYYDAPETLRELVSNLNQQIKAFFPDAAVKIVISAFSGEPSLVSDLVRRQKKQFDDRPSIITVNGSAYFTLNYTSNEIRAAFNNYTQTIVLANVIDASSLGLGTFSSRYST